MSYFRTTLKVSLASEKNNRWKLIHRLVFVSDDIGEIIVPAGFETDFASVPRLPLVYMTTGDTARQAAVVHDYLYSIAQHPRKVADEVFLDAMKVSGVPWIKAHLMYRAVRLFGWMHYQGA
jgi:hypothetical protein